jgi:protein-L-isoaspartate(D-aspartate) O-methyltransferase
VPSEANRETLGTAIHKVIDRSLYTPDGTNPPFPVPINDICTVPTNEMAYLLRNLVMGDKRDVDLLEIGTGSGFQTAVLAESCRSVVSLDIERQPRVAERLPSNVALIIANGYEWDSSEQFDGVLVTFATTSLSSNWIRQTKSGGRLVVPLVRGASCAISVFQKVGSGLILVDVVAYAPFTQGAEA